MAEHDHHHDHDHAHDHDHGHDHGHAHSHAHGHGDPFHPELGAPLDTSEFDPASRALADALRLSFGILKLVMLALVVLYSVSGLFNVPEGHVAVRSAFGRLEGSSAENPDAVNVLDPGGPHLWFPKPFGHVIMVPTTDGRVAINRAFWIGLKPEEETKPIDQLPSKTQLQPGDDGFLITGDKNIVHGKWIVRYIVTRDSASDFIRNVSADDKPEIMRTKAEQRVAHAAESAIVHVVATVTADEFTAGAGVLSSTIASLTQKKLDAMNSGIRVVGVENPDFTAPLSVRGEFNAVTQALGKRTSQRLKAEDDAKKQLGETAGAAHAALSLAIDYYESARTAGNAAAIGKGEKALADLFDGLPAEKALAPLAGDALVDADRLAAAATSDTVSGNVASLISAAHSYRKGAEEAVRAEAETFKTLYAEYKKNPQAYMALRWNETLAMIFSKDIEVRVQQSDSLWLELNSDPRIEKHRAEKRYRQEQDANKAGQ